MVHIHPRSSRRAQSALGGEGSSGWNSEAGAPDPGAYSGNRSHAGFIFQLAEMFFGGTLSWLVAPLL